MERTPVKIGPRIPFPAAQGVTGWYRQINGTFYQFTAVTDGWWGVGPTGTIRVWRPISNGDYYPVHTFSPTTQDIDCRGWSMWPGGPACRPAPSRRCSTDPCRCLRRPGRGWNWRRPNLATCPVAG